MVDLQLMVKLNALTDLHKARLRQWQGKLDHFKKSKDHFEPEKFQKRVFRISSTMRVLTVITMAAILTNAIIVSIRQSNIEK